MQTREKGLQVTLSSGALILYYWNPKLIFLVSSNRQYNLRLEDTYK